MRPPFRYLSLEVGWTEESVVFQHFDASTNTLYGTRGETELVRSVNQGEAWSNVHTFTGAQRIRGVFVTTAGTILAIVGYAANDTRLMRSADGGDNWLAVMELDYTSYVLNGFEEHPTLGVFWGEYLGDSPDTVGVFRSLDDGQTWAYIVSWKMWYTNVGRPNPGGDNMRHVHAVQYDPYSGLIWIATGDTDSQCRLYTYDGTNVTLIGGGSQAWRFVSMTFFEDFVLLPTDANSESGAVFKYDRATGTMSVLDDRMSSLCYWTMPTSTGPALVFVSPYATSLTGLDVYETLGEGLTPVTTFEGSRDGPHNGHINIGAWNRPFQDGGYIYTNLMGVPPTLERHFVRFELGNPHVGKWRHTEF